MKTGQIGFQISPYGRASSTLDTLVEEGWLERKAITSFPFGPMVGRRLRLPHLLLAYSPDMDAKFVKLFRRHSADDTRLLVVDEEQSIDTLLTRLFELQIRSPQRLYVMEGHSEGGSHQLGRLLRRFASALASKEESNRILDARIEGGVLRLISPQFQRLEVPVAEIPQLKQAKPRQIEDFEVDEDGSFIFWPELDLHLGWSQLQQLIDPDAARKALQKSKQFNVRYGKAVQKLRVAAGLAPSDIVGLSGKQLSRIEKGACRLTSNAIDILANAHGLGANDYLQDLANELCA